MRKSSVSLLPGNRRVSLVELPKNGRERVATPSEQAAKKGTGLWGLFKRKSATPKAKPAPKPKASQATAPRRSSWGRAWLSRLSVMTGLIVVVSASLAVAWGLRRYLRTSPRFAVRNVVVEGNQRRTPTQIAQRAELVTGRNIFTIEEDAAQAAIEADPWIASAKVSVDLPNAVTVVVTEREARAVTAIDGKLLLTDASGEIFKELGESDPHDLPVITGIAAEDVARDRDGVTARIRRVFDLVDDLEEAKITERYPLQELRLDADGSVSVTVGSDGIVLTFGQPPFRNKVQKAERILEELRYRKVARAILFLDNEAHPERVVVRLQTTVKEP